jgi:hypothetical protein
MINKYKTMKWRKTESMGGHMMEMATSRLSPNTTKESGNTGEEACENRGTHLRSKKTHKSQTHLRDMTLHKSLDDQKSHHLKTQMDLNDTGSNPPTFGEMKSEEQGQSATHCTSKSAKIEAQAGVEGAIVFGRESCALNSAIT